MVWEGRTSDRPPYPDAYIQGEARGQHTLFPTTFDELIPQGHVCRVIEAFASRLDVANLGFVCPEPAETGRPGYNPRDLLRLYLYGYLWQIRSSRRLETECKRNVEVMWLLGRLVPDYKSIAEFRRMHREAVAEAGAELVRFARFVGLVRGEWVAIDGSKFQSVSSVDRIREREGLKRYLDQLERADEENEVEINEGAVTEALKKLKSDPEPEAGFMKIGRQLTPGYNVQAAVDTKGHQRCERSTHAVAHGGSCKTSGRFTSFSECDRGRWLLQRGAVGNLRGPGHRPLCTTKRTVNNHGDGKPFDRTEFVYDEKSDTFRCPASQTLWRKQFSKKDRAVMYTPRKKVCGACTLKARCTLGPRRYVSRNLYENALQRMQQRTTAEVMHLRGSTVEHPFATIKYRIFGHPRFLLRGLAGAQTEISLATMVYNLKRMLNVLGGRPSRCSCRLSRASFDACDFTKENILVLKSRLLPRLLDSFVTASSVVPCSGRHPR